MDAKEFLDLNPRQAARIVAFLASARAEPVRLNAACTVLTATLRWGRKRICTTAPVQEKRSWGWNLGEWDDKAVDSLMAAFGLGGTWKAMRRSSERYSVHRNVREELVRRGGCGGLDLLEATIRRAMASGKPLEKQRARKARGELNRALAHLRLARKSGATARQMGKLVRTVLAEEAVREVQTL